jgi:hypothetical protein
LFRFSNTRFVANGRGEGVRGYLLEERSVRLCKSIATSSALPIQAMDLQQRLEEDTLVPNSPYSQNNSLIIRQHISLDEP